MAVYIIFPNRQDLRPLVFPRDNLLTKGVALLYSVDTNTNVCPQRLSSSTLLPMHLLLCGFACCPKSLCSECPIGEIV